MATKTTKAKHERGIAIRLDITAQEYRALKFWAVEKDKSVSSLVSTLIRRGLRGREKINPVLSVSGNDDTENNSI